MNGNYRQREGNLRGWRQGLALVAAMLALGASAASDMWNAVLALPPPAKYSSSLTGAVEAVMLDGVDCAGKPTRFFAWYGLPKGASASAKVPAMVLVHGGEGTAFDWWVREWNERGYAAIAMDTCGALPVKDPTTKKWARHEFSGPKGWGGLNETDKPIHDQWTYHAVAAVIRSHTFLRSLPEVDPARVGITGISWGGYLTCIAAAVDHRYSWAMPVYGCGFNRYAPAGFSTAKLPRMGERGERWEALWDPKSYLADAQCPFLWVTGARDFAFSLTSVSNSAALVTSGNWFRIRPEMPHGQRAGSQPWELKAFADHFAFGQPMPLEFTRTPEVVADSDPLFSPSYFWMWNAKLKLPKLLSQLEDMRAHGLRNVCVHPFPKGFRPGLFSSQMDPDYLTAEYQQVFAAVAKRAGELGMHVYLYDEGGWPSGGACGKVAASDPEGRFNARRYGFPPPPPAPKGVPPPVADSTRTGECSLQSVPLRRNPDYVSILEKGATERFLEIVHAPTAKALGPAAGTTVKVAFTDEPQYDRGVYGYSLGWAEDFAEQFLARKGYDLRPFVPELMTRVNDSDDRLAKLRIDYYEVLSELVVERFYRPIQDWCHQQGMLSGGHVNGEDRPEHLARNGHGNLLKTLRTLDVPGVDTIWRQLFPGHPTTEFQATVLPFPRYASSARNQTGGKFALSESFGIYGDSLTPWQFKWVIDAQFVRGINTFVFGYYALSYARQWMLLFEPHSGPVTPYWDMLPQGFKYIERTAAMLSRGRPGAETVVLYDVRGLWAGGADCEAAAFAQYAVAKALDRMQVDYDFTDDESLAGATVTPAGLRVGAMTYRNVVLPTSKWLSGAAKAKLAEFTRAGGTVVGPEELGKVPRTLAVNGQGSTEIRVLKRVDGPTSIYFVMNEYIWERAGVLTFSEGGRIVKYDPLADRYTRVAEDGRLGVWMAGGETEIYLAGEVPDAPPAVEYAGETLELSEGWTLRPLVSHEAGEDDFVIRPLAAPAAPTALGDWRSQLGMTFSGKALYRVRFVSPRAGKARLDLGEVCWCAQARLNGQDLGSRFFGPFEFEAELKAGENELEVVVANLLANQVGDEAIRRRISAAYPPSDNYDSRQRVYDRENHQSGLFGPVRLVFQKGE